MEEEFLLISLMMQKAANAPYVSRIKVMLAFTVVVLSTNFGDDKIDF
jgi:hypothetical protein